MIFVDKLTRRFFARLAEALQKSGKLAPITPPLPEFAGAPRRLIIEAPRKIFNPDRIHFGDNVAIGPNSFLNPMTEYPTAWMKHPDLDQPMQTFDPVIRFGSNITATGGLQVTSYLRVEIEDDVMMATNVHINDGSHGYETAEIPFKYQPISGISPITIKRGAWIGQNVVILPGVTVGEMSIIGANSVVTKSIPPRCVAAGCPAKVIRTLGESR